MKSITQSNVITQILHTSEEFKKIQNKTINKNKTLTLIANVNDK